MALWKMATRKSGVSVAVVFLPLAGCAYGPPADPGFQSAYCWAEEQGMVLDEKWSRPADIKCAPLTAPTGTVGNDSALNDDNDDGNGDEQDDDGNGDPDDEDGDDEQDDNETTSGTAVSASASNGQTSATSVGNGGASAAAAGDGESNTSTVGAGGASSAGAGNGSSSSSTVGAGGSFSASAGPNGVSVSGTY